MLTESNYLGSVVLLRTGVVEPDFLPCDGRELSFYKEQALFAVLGMGHGGDFDRGTFRLPDLASPLPGLSYQICVRGLFPRREG